MSKKITNNRFTINKDGNDFKEEEIDDLSYLSESQREVVIEKAQMSVFELHRRYLREDIILRPRYQRNDVWTNTKKAKLIESVLRNIPIPSIYFSETQNGLYEVIDGQQRLISFFDFLNGDYQLSQLPVLTKLNKKNFNDLDAPLKRKIEDYQLQIFIVKKESHEDIKFDIFQRINEGASKLNAQEIRNSMYRDNGIKEIKELSKNRDFIKVVKGKVQNSRLKDQEAILRFISFYFYGYEAYNGNLNSFLNKTLEENLLSSENYKEINNLLSETMQIINEVFNEKAFMNPTSTMRKINMSLYDIIMYSVAVNIDKKKVIVENKELINHKLNELCENDNDFIKSISSNTQTKGNVTYRFEVWLDEFTKIL